MFCSCCTPVELIYLFLYFSRTSKRLLRIRFETVALMLVADRAS